MLKYFELPYTEYNSLVRRVYSPKKLIQEVNKYADENNLEITSISVYKDEGLYIAFKQKNVN